MLLQGEPEQKSSIRDGRASDLWPTKTNLRLKNARLIPLTSIMRFMVTQPTQELSSNQQPLLTHRHA
jgi:hypothetical protein